MAPKTNQFTYDFNKDKPLQKSNGLVYSKKVPFDQFTSFETGGKFTISDNRTPPYDDGLVFSIDPHTPATGGNLGSEGSHIFAFRFDNNFDIPGYLKLEIFIYYKSRGSVLVPKEFLGKELTLTASYVADTHEIKVSITDGSKPFQVILTFDLALILTTDQVEVGLFISTSNRLFISNSNVDVSKWDFKWTKTDQ